MLMIVYDVFSVRKRSKRKSPPTGGQACLCTVHSVVSGVRSKIDAWWIVGAWWAGRLLFTSVTPWLAAKGQWWAELVAVRAKIWHRWENVCINTHTYSLYEKLRYPSISGVQKSWFVYEGSVCRSRTRSDTLGLISVCLSELWRILWWPMCVCLEVQLLKFWAPMTNPRLLWVWYLPFLAVVT